MRTQKVVMMLVALAACAAVEGLWAGAQTHTEAKPGKLDIDASKSAIDGKKIEEILGHKGDGQPGGVFKVTIGRTIKMHDHEVGNMMGINTWASFAGSDDQAVCDGDFVMTEQELQPVLKALRGAGINIVAIHNHMTFEQPRAMFLHFWGIGSTTDLAKGLEAALDAQNAAGAVHGH